MIPKKVKVVVTQPEEPIAAEIIATAIVKISEATQALLSAGLKRDAIIILIHARSHVGMRDIELVLNNLATLKENWTTL